jgi:hypothetical protein
MPFDGAVGSTTQRIFARGLAVCLALYFLNAFTRALASQVARFGGGHLLLTFAVIALLGLYACMSRHERPSVRFYGFCLLAQFTRFFLCRSAPLIDFKGYADQAMLAGQGVLDVQSWKTPGTVVYFALFAATLGQGSFALAARRTLVAQPIALERSELSDRHQ